MLARKVNNGVVGDVIDVHPIGLDVGIEERLMGAARRLGVVIGAVLLDPVA